MRNYPPNNYPSVNGFDLEVVSGVEGAEGFFVWRILQGSLYICVSEMFLT